MEEAGTAFGNKVGRRTVLQFIGASTVSIFPPINNLLGQDMAQAGIVVNNMRDDIRNAVITGTNLQDLPPEQLALLRGDSQYLHTKFPRLNFLEINKLKRMIPLQKEDGVVINNTEGLLTAWRRDARCRVWVKAGFSAPPGKVANEQEAFARDTNKPVDNKVLSFGI